LSVAIWHDVECGAYTADLGLWEELAAAAEGPILELGCGTGRVALHLARRGHEVTGLDLDPELVAAFGQRAAGLPARATVGDAGDFDLPGDFALALAPMQLVQLFGDAAGRSSCLACIASHLRAGGIAALAIVEGVLGGVGGEAEAVPDAREVGGWLYASLPVETAVDAERITVRRLRKTVSPDGELHREPDQISLRVLSSEALERQGEAAGLRPAGRLHVPPTDAHVGSTVVLLGKEP
jgi:SAM-dependent methyltransferase